MRSDGDILELILSTAKADERIRAVILNGSRANPNVTPDRFQDFDVVYIVTEVTPFVDDSDWIDCFGERMILQMPDLMGEEEVRRDGGFTYLMRFVGGNRIDLTLIPIDHITDMEEDSLSVLLLDKDDRFDPFPPPNESSYLPKPPTQQAYEDCCNEFWWLVPYVVKGLVRGEILYAKHFLDIGLRNQLMVMLTWVFGIRTDFKRNPGKVGKFIKEVLAPDSWSRLLETYTNADPSDMWEGLLRMSDLFRECALEVGEEFGFEYPQMDDRNVVRYVRAILDDKLSFET